MTESTVSRVSNLTFFGALAILAFLWVKWLMQGIGVPDGLSLFWPVLVLVPLYFKDKFDYREVGTSEDWDLEFEELLRKEGRHRG